MTYLKQNQADLEAWHYLTEIYLSYQQYGKAIFCYEELVSAYPHNYYIFLTYAELLCTDKRKEQKAMSQQYLLARKYAAHAVVLNSSSPRALWTLLYICNNCAKNLKQSDVNNQKLLQVNQRNIIICRLPKKD